MAKARDIAREQFLRYKYLKANGHDDYVRRSKECEGFFDGDGQWSEKDRQTLMQERRPCETVNTVLPKINNMVGHQIENRADITFKPRDNIADPEVALILAKTVKQVHQINNYHTIETDMFEDGLIGSRAFCTLDIEFKEPGMPGDIKIRKKDPRTILVDPHSFSYDPNEWRDWMEARWLSFNEVSRIFGAKKAKDLEHKQLMGGDDGGNDSLGSESIRPLGFGQKHRSDMSFASNEQLKKLPSILVVSREHKEPTKTNWFVDPATGDTQVIPYDWDEDRIAFVAKRHDLFVTSINDMRIRHTISADDVLLFDDWSLYRTYSIVPYFAIFRWGKTLSWVWNLMSPQRVLNKMTSQELAILNTTANGGWLVEDESITNLDDDELEQYGAQTGLVIKYRRGSQKPEKIQPNQLPQGHERMALRAEDNIKEISTIGDSQLGFDREDVAAKAIIAKQSRSAINMNRVLANLERTRSIVARKTLELIQDFYTEERILRITGDDPFKPSTETQTFVINERTPEGDIINDLSIGEYDVVVSSVPASDTIMETEFEQALKMREAGIGIPDQVLIRSSNLPNKDEILESMAEDPAAQESKDLQNAKDRADVVHTLADAQKKDAEKLKILQEVENPPEQNSGGDDTSKRADALIKLADTAEKQEIQQATKPKPR